MIESQLIGNGINMDDYAKQCVMNAISAINNTLDVAGVAWNDQQLDQSNITQTLLHVASLKLNPSASPNEVFFQLRNVKLKKRNEQGKLVDVWKKEIEMGIEGDGNDAILSRFGRDVKQVRQFWEVRSEDDFQYPSFNGLEMTPPQWTPKGKGNVIKIVYPIIKDGGKNGDVIEYYIAEREDVIKNLIAHINNNLMNETFGIAESKFKATAKQKEQINEKKREIIEKVKEQGLDGSLNDTEIQKRISPAWKDEQSKESMIIRKMRNNIVKKIPKDFGHALVEMSYDDSTNDYQSKVRQEINDYANGEIIDVETDESPQEAEHQEEQNVSEAETETQPEQEPSENKSDQQEQTKEEKAPF
jgi:hypothetical protein